MEKYIMSPFIREERSKKLSTRFLAFSRRLMVLAVFGIVCVRMYGFLKFSHIDGFTTVNALVIFGVFTITSIALALLLLWWALLPVMQPWFE